MIKNTFYNLPEEKRQRITDAIFNEFAGSSGERVSINNIIKNANISRGSFYQYFDDKVDLVEVMTRSFINFSLKKATEVISRTHGDIFVTYDLLFEILCECSKDAKQSIIMKNLIKNIKANDSLVSEYFISQPFISLLKKRGGILLLTGFMLVMVSCSPTRYVGKDEYLLNKVKVRVEEKGVNFSELKKTVRQRPNTRILGVARFHLGLYNLSGKNENKRFNKWLRSIGEAPVIYSPFLTDRSVTQLKLYLNNKGFYKAEVTDSVWFKKKKAHVVYRIYPGPLTRVKDFTFREDSSFRAGGLSESSPLVQLVLRDTNHTLLHQEMPMDIEILEDERERITHMLRQNGYYNFSKNFIHYYADTSRSGNPEQAYRQNVVPLPFQKKIKVL